MLKPWSHHSPLQASDTRLARSVFLLLFALYVSVFNGLPPGVDGEVCFQVTSSLVRQGSLGVGGTPEAESMIAHAKSVEPGTFAVRQGTDGADAPYYTWYGIGDTISALPFYLVGHVLAWMSPRTEAAHAQDTRFGSGRSEYYEHLITGLRNPLLSAATACVLVLIARRLGVARNVAFLAGIGYGLCTYALPQARAWFSDVQGAFFLCAAFYGLLLLRDQWSTRRCAIFGVALAMASLTRVSLIPAALVLDCALLWLLVQLRRSSYGGPRIARMWPSLVALWLPQLLALGLWCGTNQWRFGNPFDSGYGVAIAGGLLGGDPWAALVGLLISPGKGLLWMAPGLLLLGFGLRRAYQERETGIVLVLVLTSCAVIAPVLLMVGWHGAWTYGPRYVLPAMPLLWVLASQGFQRSTVDHRIRPAAWVLLFFGLVTQIPGALVDTMTYHDLAVRAAEERFPIAPGELPANAAEARFQAIQMDWGFAAPWAHWRILRHQVALPGEPYPSAELFRWPTDQMLTPSQLRETGFRHMAWVDLRHRLGGNIWSAIAAIVMLVLLGTADAIRGLDP